MEALKARTEEVAVLVFLFLYSILTAQVTAADPQLMIRDDASDAGAEPYNISVPWESPDIWIAAHGMLDASGNQVYRPEIFNTATPPTWLTDWKASLTAHSLSDEEAAFSDSPGAIPNHKYGKPNYIYVWIRNVGTAPSTGREVLKVYWAKASTGLDWPNNWQKSFGSPFSCTANLYLSDEVTKPRKNAAYASATERAEYIAAIQAIDNASDPNVVYGADGVTFWDKQDQIHGTTGSPIHFQTGFLPWHREYIARYELLLQSVRPGLTLLYWDWQTDPASSGSPPFNFFTATFMGASGRGTPNGTRVGVPFDTFDGNLDCTLSRNGQRCSFNSMVTASGCPAACTLNINDYTRPPPVIKRQTASGTPITAWAGVGRTFFTDAAIEARTAFMDSVNDVYLPPNMAADPGPSSQMAYTLEYGAHNLAHVYLGFGGFANQVNQGAAAEDPFFFLLHANVDRIFATWQRNAALNSVRYDRASAYQGPGGDPGAMTSPWITQSFPPWNGNVNTPVRMAAQMVPWRSVAGDVIGVKNAFDGSVLYPPIYENRDASGNPLIDGLLRIPVLGMGQSIIMEIPWYPPDPNQYSCFPDPHHFCILARIERVPTAPFGMNNPEHVGGGSIGYNVTYNANIAWRNVSVLDTFHLSATKTVGVLMRNTLGQNSNMRLRLEVPPADAVDNVFRQGRLEFILSSGLFNTWASNGAQGQGLGTIDDNRHAIQLLYPTSHIAGITMSSNQTELVQVAFTLSPNYTPPAGKIYGLRVIQEGLGGTNGFIGGQTLRYDFNKLVLLPKGEVWKFWDRGRLPADNWTSPLYDDKAWPAGAAELGFGDDPVTVVDAGPTTNRNVTFYFRRTFSISDVSYIRTLQLLLKRDDGAVVYLNGAEVARDNMPAGAISYNTRATSEVSGIAEETCFPIDISAAIPRLVNGPNVVAVEVHQASTTNADLSFDLEINANNSFNEFRPPVAFGKLGPVLVGERLQTWDIPIEAVDPDGSIQKVDVYVDNVLRFTTAQSQFNFSWANPPVGRHDIRTVATDDNFNTSVSHLTAVVYSNVPPRVTLTSPQNMAMVSGPFDISATASDLSGTIQKVTFVVVDDTTFRPEVVFAADDSTAPYGVTGVTLPEGHYEVYAVGTDSFGSQGASVSHHIMVHQAPRLQILWMNRDTLMVVWDGSPATLEATDSLTETWKEVYVGTGPYHVVPSGWMRFFRLKQ